MSRLYYIEPHHYETAEKNGISKKYVDNRFYEKGWTLERAITQPLRERSTHGWDKWKDVAKVSKKAYMQRVRLGWEHEKAALTPTLSRKEVATLSATKHSLFTPEQVELMKENNIPRMTAYMRVKKLGWTKEKAVTEPIVSNKEALKRARGNGGFQSIIYGNNRRSI